METPSPDPARSRVGRESLREDEPVAGTARRHVSSTGSINQAATLGFSASLGYASRRSETFLGYLSGKQPLLHESFTGDDESYIYQEIPSRRGKAGVTGRGLEGLTGALLKVVGI